MSNNSTYTTQNDLLLKNLMVFYNTEDNDNLDDMLRIITGESKISLRIVDWFSTNYAKKYYTLYVIEQTAENVARRFKVYDDSYLSGYVGSSFFPFNTTNNSDKGGQTRDTFRGTQYLDVSRAGTTFDRLDADDDNYAQIQSQYYALFRFSTSNSPTTHNLKLNIYRSGIDPSFAVLSYNQPSVTGKINDSTFSTFIIHNFNSNLWNLNEVFSAGITFIDKDPSLDSSNGSTSFIGFKTILTGNYYAFGGSVSTRTAEAGWSQIVYDSHTGTQRQMYTIASTKTNYTSS